MNEVKTILDSFVECGSDLKDLEKCIKTYKMSKFVCDSKQISLLHYFAEDDNKLFFSELSPSDLFLDGSGDIKDYTVSIKKADVIKKSGEPLIEEMKKGSRLMFYIVDGKSKELFFASPNVMSTMSRFGLAGDFLQTPTLARDIIIAEQFKRNSRCTIAYKNANQIRKAFAVLSGNYGTIDQNIIFKAIEEIAKNNELGKPVCHRWEMTNFLTSVYIEFPDKAKELAETYELKDEFVPGILILTSDTGDSSFKFVGTWRHGNAITYHEEIKRKHVGKIKDIVISAFIKAAEENIFSQYAKYPKALCEAMSIDVTKEEWNLFDEKDILKNQKAISNTIKAFSKQLQFTKVIGKKHEKEIVSLLINEFDPQMSYSLYDFVISISSLPDRVDGLNKTLLENLRKTCGSAAYIDFNSLNNEEKIILTV